MTFEYWFIYCETQGTVNIYTTTVPTQEEKVVYEGKLTLVLNKAFVKDLEFIFPVQELCEWLICRHIGKILGNTQSCEQRKALYQVLREHYPEEFRVLDVVCRLEAIFLHKYFVQDLDPFYGRGFGFDFLSQKYMFSAKIK